MTGYSFTDKSGMRPPAIFADAANGRVLLSEMIGKHSRVDTLLVAMANKGLEPPDLVHRAKAMAAQDPSLKIPEGFRSAEMEKWFAGGKNATAPRELFEFALRVTEAAPPARNYTPSFGSAYKAA